MIPTWARALMLCGLVSACVTGETKVVFTESLQPHLDDIGHLAVSLEGDFDDKSREEIVKALKNCPLYTDVRFLNAPLAITTAATPDLFEQHLQKFAKGSYGLLRLRMEHIEVSEETEKSQSFILLDQPTYDWYPSFGVPRQGTMGFADSMEIAPEIKKRRKQPTIRTSRIQEVYRLSLYHKGQGRILVDRVGKNISALSVFTPDPSFKRTQFESLVRASLLSDIQFYTCPEQTEVTRHIYSAGGTSATAKGVNEGVTAAKAGDWANAASRWNETINADPKSALAHHNLGVALEREGNIPEALRHYRLGIKDKRVLEDAFGDVVSRFLPQNVPMEPTIVQITGGSWVFVDVPGDERRTKASVYRITPIIDPDSARVIGQTLKEVATLRFVSTQDARRVARIREYLLDNPPRVGDIVVFADNPAPAPKPAREP